MEPGKNDSRVCIILGPTGLPYVINAGWFRCKGFLLNNVHEKGKIIFLTVHIVDLLFLLGKTKNKNSEPKSTKKERGGGGKCFWSILPWGKF